MVLAARDLFGALPAVAVDRDAPNRALRAWTRVALHGARVSAVTATLLCTTPPARVRYQVVVVLGVLLLAAEAAVLGPRLCIHQLTIRARPLELLLFRVV